MNETLQTLSKAMLFSFDRFCKKIKLLMMLHKDIIILYDEIIKNLNGDWLLVGGALLHVLGISDRVTIDINLVPLQEITNKDQLKIMEIAGKNNFPPETINFSAEYFVKKPILIQH